MIALVGVTDLTTHWLSGSGITQGQIDAIQTAFPDAVGGIKDAIAAKNYFGIIMAIGGFITAIWRAKFTAGAPLTT